MQSCVGCDDHVRPLSSLCVAAKIKQRGVLGGVAGVGTGALKGACTSSAGQCIKDIVR